MCDQQHVRPSVNVPYTIYIQVRFTIAAVLNRAEFNVTDLVVSSGDYSIDTERNIAAYVVLYLFVIVLESLLFRILNVISLLPAK